MCIGVQAQTVANYYLAKSQNLVIIPVLNKVDLKGANPEACQEQLKTLFDIDKKSVLKVSCLGSQPVKCLFIVIQSAIQDCKHD